MAGKLSAQDKKNILARLAKGESASVIAKDFSISDGAVYYVRMHARKRATRKTVRNSNHPKPALSLAKRLAAIEAAVAKLQEGHKELVSKVG